MNEKKTKNYINENFRNEKRECNEVMRIIAGIRWKRLMTGRQEMRGMQEMSGKEETRGEEGKRNECPPARYYFPYNS